MTVKKVKGGYRATWTAEELGYRGATTLYIPQASWEALVASMTKPEAVADRALQAAEGRLATDGVNNLRFKLA